MGFFKKIFKGIGKIWKAIGKRIKKAFKKVGKWFGKLGVFGQIALSFIPGIGPMLSGLFKGLGQGALAVLKKGLTATGLGSKVVRGASWLVDTARKVVGGVQKGFKTITSGATSFISNTTKYLGSKIPGVNKLINQAPETFFGTGGDSVLGRVGAEVTNNFNDFKDAIGGMLRGPEGRAALIEKDLATTKIGGVEVDARQIELTEKPDYLKGIDPSDIRSYQIGAEGAMGQPGAYLNEASSNLVQDISTGIGQNLGSEAQSNFNKLFEGQYNSNASDFLKVVQARPGFVNEFINMGPKKVDQWFKSAGFQASGQVGPPPKNPFENMAFPDPNNLDVETDKGFFSLGSSGDGSSLLSKAGKSLTSSAANLPGSLFTSAVTQAATGTDYAFPTPDPSRSLTQQNQVGYFRFGGGQQLEESALAFGGIGTDPYGFLPGYNQILSGMFNDGQSQGMYGFPGFNYGMPQQLMA